MVCIHPEMDLFRANNTSHDLLIDVWRTWQSAALYVCVIDDVLTVRRLRGLTVMVMDGVHTDELGTTRVSMVVGHDVPRVLLGPPGRTDVGSGYHDGSGT